MNKYIKIGIIIVIVTIIALIIKMFLTGNTEDKIFDYIENQGYTLNENGLYEKNINNLTEEDYNYYVSLNTNIDYGKDTFDPKNFQIIRNSFEYQDKLTSNLIATYDYTNSTLIYTYRIMGDNLNVIYRGDYNNQKFNCTKELASGVVLNKSDDLICKKVEISILKFNLEATTFFKNANFDKYLKKQNTEK